MTKQKLSKLAELLERIKRATEARGKKAELARWLGTKPQRVNDWLSGVNAPGGEVTLLLLDWVTTEEAKQQKALAVLIAPPERATPKRSNNDKAPQTEPTKHSPKRRK